MIQIQLQPEIEARLAEEAKTRGLTLNRYIIEKLAESDRVAPPGGRRSISEAIDTIRALRRGNLLGGLKPEDLVHEGHNEARTSRPPSSGRSA